MEFNLNRLPEKTFVWLLFLFIGAYAFLMYQGIMPNPVDLSLAMNVVLGSCLLGVLFILLEVLSFGWIFFEKKYQPGIHRLYKNPAFAAFALRIKKNKDYGYVKVENLLQPKTRQIKASAGGFIGICENDIARRLLDNLTLLAGSSRQGLADLKISKYYNCIEENKSVLMFDSSAGGQLHSWALKEKSREMQNGQQTFYYFSPVNFSNSCRLDISDIFDKRIYECIRKKVPAVSTVIDESLVRKYQHLVALYRALNYIGYAGSRLSAVKAFLGDNFYMLLDKAIEHYCIQYDSANGVEQKTDIHSYSELYKALYRSTALSDTYSIRGRLYKWSFEKEQCIPHEVETALRIDIFKEHYLSDYISREGRNVVSLIDFYELPSEEYSALTESLGAILAHAGEESFSLLLDCCSTKSHDNTITFRKLLEDKSSLYIDLSGLGQEASSFWGSLYLAAAALSAGIDSDKELVVMSDQHGSYADAEFKSMQKLLCGTCFGLITTADTPESFIWENGLSELIEVRTGNESLFGRKKRGRNVTWLTVNQNGERDVLPVVSEDRSSLAFMFRQASQLSSLKSLPASELFSNTAAPESTLPEVNLNGCELLPADSIKEAPLLSESPNAVSAEQTIPEQRAELQESRVEHQPSDSQRDTLKNPDTLELSDLEAFFKEVEAAGSRQ